MQSGQEVVSLHLDDIIPNRFQPREVFDEKALKELAASIREHGVIQPIIVRQVNNKYEIIAGERRYKASALAGMTKIPAIINNLDDKEAAKVALLENLQRRNLNPIEEARTYQKILELDQMTQEALARTMGKSQSAVSNKLRLLALPDEIQTALLKEEISERHARTFLNLKDPEEQKELLSKVINEKMSVRSLEEEIRRRNENSNVNQNQNISQNMSGGETMNNNIPGMMQFAPNMNVPTTQMQMPSDSKPNLMSSSAPSAPQNDIVNYGNIDEDELYNDNNNNIDYSIFGSSTSQASQSMDVSKIKSDSMDINKLMDTNQFNSTPSKSKNQDPAMNSITERPEANVEKAKISNDLDSLLNIQPAPKSVNNGFTTMEAIKNSEDSVGELDKKDYFNAQDLSSIQLPNIGTTADAYIKDYQEPMRVQDQYPEFNQNNQNNQNNRNNNMNTMQNMSFFQNSKTNNQPEEKKNNKSLGMALIEETYNIERPSEKKKTYNVQQVVQEIRDVIKEIGRSGAKIDTDEIDFENEYQIVIRIDKNSL